MTPHRRSRIRKLWNRGSHSFSDIAADLDIPVDDVAAWLQAQPGFPGMVNAKPLTCKASGCGKEFWAAHGGQRYCSAECSRWSRPPLTLPQRSPRKRVLTPAA